MATSPTARTSTRIAARCIPETLCRKVVEHKAHLGIAHDGDADRVLLCDEKGKLIDGDDIMAIAALDMLAQKTLAEKTLVATVMSNAGLEAAIKNAGGKIIRTAVGDRNVIDEMLRNGFNFGGEQSGHLIFRDFSTTGDGLVAALQILRIMQRERCAAFKTGEMLDALPATGHQRQRAREEAVRAIGRRDETGGRGGNGIESRRAAACCCAIPARNRRRACCSKAATRKFWKVVKKNLRRDSEADWRA